MIWFTHSLKDYHIVEVETWGPGDIASGTAFHVHTVRKNPATVGHVTGSATYNSFLSSVLGRCSKHCEAKTMYEK